MLNPLHLINAHVSVKKINYMDEPASVIKLQKNKYEIRINTQWITKNFPLHLHQAVETGLLLHEVAHIKYGSFSGQYKKGTLLLSWIDNLLEDARIEYALSRHFPYAAKLFAVITAMMPRLKHKKLDELNAKLDALYSIVRFGVIPDGFDDYDFLNFVIPRTIVSRRGDRKQCIRAALDIYRYLYDQFARKQKRNNNSGSSQSVQEDLEANVKSSSNFGHVEPDKDKEIKGEKAINTQISEEEANNLLGALETAYQEYEVMLVDHPKPDNFYVSVLEKRSIQIEQLVSVIEQLLEKKLYISLSHDGDLNISKVQNAYISSITGDGGRFFNRISRSRLSADVLIIRDISASTSGIRDKYAEAVIMICEALSRIGGINIAVIDFNHEAYLIKKFSDELALSHIWPRAYGSTRLGRAMKLATQNIPWTQDSRIVFIITDGYPDSWAEVYEAMELEYFKSSKIIPVVITNCGYIASDMIKTFGTCANVVDVASLPNELATLFAKTIRGGM